MIKLLKVTLAILILWSFTPVEAQEPTYDPCELVQDTEWINETLIPQNYMDAAVRRVTVESAILQDNCTKPYMYTLVFYLSSTSDLFYIDLFRDTAPPDEFQVAWDMITKRIMILREILLTQFEEANIKYVQ